MKSKTQEWIEKAEGDWATMLRENLVVVNPNFDAICFHAQQCVEKYLKGRLCEADINFRRTHDLLNLLDSLLEIEPTWIEFEELIGELSIFAVAYRYPGFAATREQSTKSAENCKIVRDLVRNYFGLQD
jgi:HEPN domain-containing protein